MIIIYVEFIDQLIDYSINRASLTNNATLHKHHVPAGKYPDHYENTPIQIYRRFHLQELKRK